MKILRSILLSLILFSTYAQATNYPSLWQSGDADLQKSLEQLLQQQGLADAVSNDRLALTLVDISDPENPKVASVNGDNMYYAASLPKIAILLGAFVEIERGKLQLTDQLWSDMNQMIRKSSNVAATRVLDTVGRNRLLEILQSPKYGLYDRKHSGGLWVGKAYSSGSAYQRDPLKHLSHGATSMQAARFYYLLETNRLVSDVLTKKMKQVLLNPAIAHKFVKGLESLPELALYRKSGSWKQYHADSVMVEANGYKYIMVGLAQSRHGGEWLEQLALPLHNMITKTQ
jgi:beta-lactamase class A